VIGVDARDGVIHGASGGGATGCSIGVEDRGGV
jgi:hypothetical protein